MASVGCSSVSCSGFLADRNGGSAWICSRARVFKLQSGGWSDSRMLSRAKVCSGTVRACSKESSSGDRDSLMAQFIRHVECTQQAWPLEGRRPSHLMPPSTVVKVLMEALMRNDWPEDDSGIRTAFAFAMPPAANEMLVSDVGQSSRLARAWYATEKYLNLDEFANVIRDITYLPLLDFVSWYVVSPMTFHGRGDKRAVQAVRTVSQAGVSRTFTFCLEKVVNGVYKGCWMIVGVRVGDYANV